MLHPVTNILAFLILASFIAVAKLKYLLASLLFLALIALFTRSSWLLPSLRMLKKMRWLFLSLFVLYLWMTPGTTIFSWNARWLPTTQGVQQGLLRVSVLVLLVFAVNLLVVNRKREELAAALLYLLTPLRILGLDLQRFATRLALTFDALTDVQNDIKKRSLNSAQTNSASSSGRQHASESAVSSFQLKLESTGRYAANILSQVVIRAHDRSLVEVNPVRIEGPSYKNWIVPVSITIVLVAL